MLIQATNLYKFSPQSTESLGQLGGCFRFRCGWRFAEVLVFDVEMKGGEAVEQKAS